jgi:hypothetical protein
MTLEDRVVPGEMFGTSMLWAMGAFADAATFVPDTSSDTRPSVVRSESSPADSSPSLPYVDARTLAICHIDRSSPDTAPASSPSSEPVAPVGPAADASTPASDQVFSSLTPDGEFGNMLDNLSTQTSSMGDLLHPGTQTPPATNAALGGAAGAVLQSLVPSMTPSVANGGGGLQTGSNSAAGLATFANMMTNAAMPMASGGQAAAATPASDSGGFATPLNSAKKVDAPNRIHNNAANGAAPFSPAQISQAYGLNLISNTGSGQTIYIVDAYNDPNISSDLATFDSQWGLPAASLTVHKMSSRVANSSSWGVEESLDVEWAHAIAPAANIVLVEATSSSNSALFSAVNWATSSGAKIVSMSWGGTDSSGDTSYNTYFEHSGVTYIASAGDSASALEYPAASPYVLSVGGTSLTLTTSNAYSSETAWSSGGGGVSKYEAEPGYQTSFGIKNSGRGIPDVAWDADPNTGVYVYDSYIRGGGGWYEVGGTSVGAPSWAGLIALADQNAATPLTTDSLTSRTEYSAAATSTLYASNYHDVTTGSNGHAAGVGYDLATGIGSPQANNLIPWLSANG